MKICWDNLEVFKLTKRKNFRDINKKITWYFIEKCKNCGEPFLAKRKNQKFCNQSCAQSGENNPNYKPTHKHHSEKPKKSSMEKIETGWKWKNIENHNWWKGGYRTNNIPMYDTYAPQIEWCENVRRNDNDRNILEVKCTYCGKWYIPKWHNIRTRIQVLKGNKKYPGEHRLYCSNECKRECSIYHKIKYPKGFKTATSREVQPELRQLVFQRDNHKCQKCGSTKSLHCHHLEGIRWEPLESADLDMCITLCKTCHLKVHKKEDCGYHDLQCITI